MFYKYALKDSLVWQGWVSNGKIIKKYFFFIEYVKLMFSYKTQQAHACLTNK